VYDLINATPIDGSKKKEKKEKKKRGIQ